MKVTFDSNVWRWVVAPEDTPSGMDPSPYIKINQLCVDGLIIGYLSGSIFAWEAVKRIERKDILGKDRGHVTISELNEVDDCLSRTISFGPDLRAHPGTPEKFNVYLEKARMLGFHFMHIPRHGYLTNPDLKETDWVAYKLEIGERFAEVVELIESRGCGMTQLVAIGQRYATDWLRAMEIAPESEIKRIAKAVAEWADGDSVAIHLAYGNDFFCTDDKAKGAGRGSVMAPKHVERLGEAFGFKKVSPQELVSCS